MKVAVVGVGYLGRFHAQKYAALPECELAGVYDVNPEVARRVAEELQVPVLTSLEQVANQAQAVTVASSTQSHYEVAKLLLSRGVSVHVEKPMTAELWQAEELCALAAKHKCVLQVGHVERFNKALIAAREKLRKPLFIECHRLAPFKPRGVDVDVVLDLMIHDIDVVLSLVGSEVVTVSAVGTPVLTKTYDIANARLEFASGAVANLTASRVSMNAVRKLRVFQDSQYLSIDFGKGEVSLLTKTGEWQDDNIPLEHETWSLEKGDALLEETRSFVAAVREGGRPVVSGEDGLVALKVAERVRGEIARRLSPDPASSPPRS